MPSLTPSIMAMRLPQRLIGRKYDQCLGCRILSLRNARLQVHSYSTKPQPQSQRQVQPTQYITQAPIPQSTSPTTFNPSPINTKGSYVSGSPTTVKDKDGEFIPQPLDRPLGSHTPPLPGENSGIDTRTWREKRDDFFNYDRHLVKRRKMMVQAARPYFRDWSAMRFSKGKTFIAPKTLFKAERALWFPNLQGPTLESGKELRDTTTALAGKVSLVRVYCGLWAQGQCETWTRGRDDVWGLKADEEGVQVVDINYESESMRATLVKMFRGSLKRQVPQHRHAAYFMVHRGVDDDLRNSLGWANEKVGYLYLVDWNCKVRWAGSAEATDEERTGLEKGLSKLKTEWKAWMEKRSQTTVQEAVETPGSEPTQASASA